VGGAGVEEEEVGGARVRDWGEVGGARVRDRGEVGGAGIRKMEEERHWSYTCVFPF
jgi:hypothetical protein